jgi:hypothetical protein
MFVVSPIILAYLLCGFGHSYLYQHREDVASIFGIISKLDVE